MASAYIATNLIASSSATLTASTEDSVYPLANLYDLDLANTFRFTSAAGGWIESDFAAEAQFDTVALLNHNASAAATFLMQVGASSPPTTGIAAPAYRAANLWADMTAQSKQFLRVNVTDSGSSNTQIGELVVGTRVVLPRARRYGNQPLGVARTSKTFESTRGRRRSYKLFQRESRIYSWRVDESEIQQILDFFEAVQGDAIPFLWIPDTAGTECFYARLDDGNILPQEQDKAKLYDVMIKLSEESRGIEIAA